MHEQQNDSIKEELIDDKDSSKKKTKEISIFKYGENEDDEKKRFNKYSPLVTLLLMSLGPLSNVVSAVFETLNMYFITKNIIKLKIHMQLKSLDFLLNIKHLYQ